MMGRRRIDVSWATLWKAGFWGAVVGIIGSIVVFFGASLLGAMPQDIYVYADADQQQPFTIGAIVVTTILTAVLAVPVFRALVWLTTDPAFFFRIVAAIVFIFMIPAPLRIEGAPITMSIALLIMHVIVTLAIVGSLERSYRKQLGEDKKGNAGGGN